MPTPGSGCCAAAAARAGGEPVVSVPAVEDAGGVADIALLTA
jgi:hypothetical protein